MQLKTDVDKGTDVSPATTSKTFGHNSVVFPSMVTVNCGIPDVQL